MFYGAVRGTATHATPGLPLGAFPIQSVRSTGSDFAAPAERPPRGLALIFWLLGSGGHVQRRKVLRMPVVHTLGG